MPRGSLRVALPIIVAVLIFLGAEGILARSISNVSDGVTLEVIGAATLVALVVLFFVRKDVLFGEPFSLPKY